MIKKLLSATMICASAFGFSQQLPNSGFENWTSGNPDNWGNLDATLTGAGVTGTNLETQVSPGNSGSSACQLKTANVIVQLVPGAVCSGPITLNGFTPVFNGTPYTSSPTSFTFYYKYSPVSGDSASAQAMLTKWNTSTNSRDTLAYGGMYVTNAAASFTQATVPFIPMMAGTPDSCTMVFISGNVAMHANTTFTIDDVNMVTATGISEPFMLNTYAAYPNPASDVLNIVAKDAKASKVQVYDATGRMIDAASFEDGKVKLNLEKYNSGLYIYRIVDANNQALKSSRFNVSK